MTGRWTAENRWSGTFGKADCRTSELIAMTPTPSRGRQHLGRIARFNFAPHHPGVDGAMAHALVWRRARARSPQHDLHRGLPEKVVERTHSRRRRGARARSIRGARRRNQSYRFTTPPLFAEHVWTPESWVTVTSTRASSSRVRSATSSARASPCSLTRTSNGPRGSQRKGRVRADAADRRDRGIRSIAFSPDDARGRACDRLVAQHPPLEVR